jgi:hypothetical protein
MKSKINKISIEDKYPRNYPIPPDKLDPAKLNLILKRELTEWEVVNSPLPENPFVERQELQFVSQPEVIPNRQRIVKLVDDFNSYANAARLKRLSAAQVISQAGQFALRLEEVIRSLEFKPRIFFSYAWGEEREEIVDALTKT